MNLTIFGASGRTGREIVAQALSRGHQVSAAVRRPEAISISHPALRVVRADLADAATMIAAVAGCDAVLSAIGAPMSRAPTSVHADSARAIVAAMRAAGVRRLICVTSGGASPNPEPNLPWLFAYGFKRIFANIYADQVNMERVVMASDLDWTIVRPAGLNDRPASGRCRHIEGFAIKGATQTPRADLAAFMLDQLADPTYVRKGVALAR